MTCKKGLPARLAKATAERADRHGFTLIELLVYTAIFAIVAGLLTSIFFIIINSQKKASVSGEVSQQLNFVLVTVQRLIGDASLVEAVYEGQSPSSTCATFCTLRLRRTDPTKDPTLIFSNATGIYLQEGSTTQVTLTTNKVLVNNLKFTKNDIPGGHAVVQITTSFSYNTDNPTFAVTKAIESAIARVNAATFDADLLPNQDNTFDIGQIGSNLRWKSGRFSGDLTVGGNVGIGTTSPSFPLDVLSGTGVETVANFTTGLTAGAGVYRTLNLALNKTTAVNDGPAFFFRAKDANGTMTDLADIAGIITDRTAGAASGALTFTIRNAGTLVDRMIIDKSGNVGIGTTSPLRKLDVLVNSVGVTNDIIDAATTGAGGQGLMLGVDTTNRFTYLKNNTSPTYGFQIQNETGAPRVTVDSSGNVGIGVSPSYKLDVDGTIKTASVYAGNVWSLVSSINTPADNNFADKVAMFTLVAKTDNDASINARDLFYIGSGGGDHTRGGRGTKGRLMLDASGNLSIKGVLTQNANPDIAENVKVFDYTIEAGDLVIASQNKREDSNPYNRFYVEKASRPYDTYILGVISDRPGIILNAPSESFQSNSRSASNERLLSLAGRVLVKVTNENGAIQAGDYLTSSLISGVAMKAVEPGRVIGMALESFNDEGIGKILVFVNPGWHETGTLSNRAVGKGNSLNENLLDRIGASIRKDVITFAKLIAEKLSVRDIDIRESVILHAPNGSCFRVNVNNDGLLISEPTSCP